MGLLLIHRPNSHDHDDCVPPAPITTAVIMGLWRFWPPQSHDHNGHGQKGATVHGGGLGFRAAAFVVIATLPQP